MQGYRFGSVPLLAGGEVVIGPGWSTGSTPPYRSADHVLYEVLDGSCAVEVDGTWHELAPGQLVLLTFNHWHRRRCSGRTRKRFLHFRLASVSLDLLLASTNPVCVFPVAEHQDWQQALALASQVMDLNHRPRPPDAVDPRCTWRLEGALQQLVATALPPLAEGVGEVDDAVARAAAYLDKHYRQRPSLNAVATAAGCSARHLHNRFLAVFARTPLTYAEERRMQDAEHLLRMTDLPVGEVARRCGYPDPLHFSRVVRRSLGRSPKDLRQG